MHQASIACSQLLYPGTGTGTLQSTSPVPSSRLGNLNKSDTHGLPSRYVTVLQILHGSQLEICPLFLPFYPSLTTLICGLWPACSAGSSHHELSVDAERPTLDDGRWALDYPYSNWLQHGATIFAKERTVLLESRKCRVLGSSTAMMGSDFGDSGRSDRPNTQQSSEQGANGQDIGKGKGKDLAGDETDREAKKQTAGDDSVISRIGRSAAGLSRSVLHGTPSASDLANAASSGKSGPSSSSSNGQAASWAEGSTAAPVSISTDASAFRSRQADAHVASEEAAFSDFLDNTGAFIPAAPAGLEQAWHDVATYGAPEQSTTAGHSKVAEQQDQDGIEVVRLLSQVDEEVPVHDEGTSISDAEIRNLRQALFEEGSPVQMSAADWNNILNFVPDYLRGDDGVGHDGSDVAHSSYMALGVSGPAEAGQLWLDQWNRVLTSYNDEVWGDLGDLVKEARTEIGSIKNTQDEQQQQDPTALRRLRAVLTQVRARL